MGKERFNIRYHELSMGKSKKVMQFVLAYEKAEAIRFGLKPFVKKEDIVILDCDVECVAEDGYVLPEYTIKKVVYTYNFMESEKHVQVLKCTGGNIKKDHTFAWLYSDEIKKYRGNWFAPAWE